MVVAAEVVRGQIGVEGRKRFGSPASRAGALLLTILLMSGCSFLDRLTYQTPEEQCLSNTNSSNQDKFTCLYKRLDAAALSYEYFFHNRSWVKPAPIHPVDDEKVQKAFEEFKRSYTSLEESRELGAVLGPEKAALVRDLLLELYERINASHNQRFGNERIETGGRRSVEKLRELLQGLLYPPKQPQQPPPQPKSP